MSQTEPVNKVQIVIEAKDSASIVFRSLEASIEAMTREGKNSVDRLGGAFKTLNLKSAFDIEKEKVRIKSAFDQIRTSGVASATEIKRANQAMQRQLNALNRELVFSRDGFLSMKNMTGPLAAATRMLGPALAGVGVFEFGRQCVEASLQMDRLKIMMSTGVGAENAAREIAFVRSEAERLGISLPVAIEQYAKFAAAAKGTSLTGEEVRGIFSSVAETSRALGMTTQDTAGAFLALTQVMSKGKVSMEEMRQQLGERLVGAMQIAARSMGILPQEFEEMVAQGLVADDFLRKFAEQLHTEFGPAAVAAAGTAAAEFERMNTAIFEAKTKIGGSLTPALASMVPVAEGLAKGVAMVVKGWHELFVTVKYVADLYAALGNAGGLAGILNKENREAFNNTRQQLTQAWEKTIADIEMRYSDDKMNFVRTEQEKLAEAAKAAEQRKVQAQKVKIDSAYRVAMSGSAQEIT